MTLEMQVMGDFMQNITAEENLENLWKSQASLHGSNFWVKGQKL